MLTSDHERQVAVADGGGTQRPTAPGCVSESPMLRGALRLLEQFPGVLIVPATNVTADGRCSCYKGANCGSPGKHPREDKWRERTLSSAQEVRAYWTQHPEANVGIATGIESGIIVLDVDGEKGEATLAGHEAKHGKLPPCPTVLTSRGRHLYFAAGDVPLRNRAGARGRGLGEGLDVRGEGGFAVAPPSKHASGFEYCCAPGLQPGEVPLRRVVPWIEDSARDLAEHIAPIMQLPLPSRSVSQSRREAWADGALTRECNNVRNAPEGTRNDTLNEAAFNMGMKIAGAAIDGGIVRRALHQAAVEAGLGELEAEKTIRRGISDGMKKDQQSGPRRDLPMTRTNRYTPAPRSCDEQYEPPGPDKPTVAPIDLPEETASPAARTQVRYQLLADTIEQQLRPVGARLSTGIATLDRALRGGLPMRRCVVPQGPPGSGKTSVMVELMHRWSLEGIACVWLAADETPAGIITRLGQLAGYGRDALEGEGADSDKTRSRFAAECFGQPLVVLDPDEGASTIEDAASVLEHLESLGPRVLFVDSLQTARCAAAQSIDSVREKIDAKLKVLKAIAQRGSLVIAASEVSRGAYRSQDRSQHIDPLAAAKESGGIEYGVDVLLSLSSVRGSSGLIDVAMPKNRLGEKLSFRLQQDFVRASFEEVELREEESVDARESNLHRAAVQRVRDVVLKHLQLKSQRDVLAVCPGRRADNARAVRALELEGQLVREGGFFRLRGAVEGEAHAAE